MAKEKLEDKCRKAFLKIGYSVKEAIEKIKDAESVLDYVIEESRNSSSILNKYS